MPERGASGILIGMPDTAGHSYVIASARRVCVSVIVAMAAVAVLGLLPVTSGAQAASKRRAVLVKDIHRGRAGSSSGALPGCHGDCYIGGLLAGSGRTVYLSVNDGKHGYELWKSDGTRKGTRLVKDINPGPGWSSIYGATVVNRILYFGANDGVHGAELWRSDGTAQGTRMVKDINPGPASGAPGELTGIGGTLYFDAFDGTQPPGELWRTDGTEAGTTLVKRFPDRGLFPLIDVNSTLYFGAFDGSHSALWRSDGTDPGTTLVKPQFLNTFEFTAFNGGLFFRGDDGASGPDLWRSDGTEAGTTMVKELNSANPYLPCCFTNANGVLYFLSSASGLFPHELWRSDGTGTGTTLVKQLKGGILAPIVARGRIVYFGAGGGLWRSNGTPRGTTLVKGFLPGGPGHVSVGSLTATKRSLYFASADRKHGEELWRSDGTRKGTMVVSDIRRGTPSSHPQSLLAVGGTLFFTAKEGRHGRELWRAGPPLR